MARLELASKRIERQQARLEAAAREGVGEALEIDLGGGQPLLEIPAELPLWALQPFVGISEDVFALLYRVLQIQDGGTTQAEALRDAVGLVAGNGGMPQQVIDAVCECTRRLVGDAGLAQLVEFRPTREDVVELTSAVLRHYGLMPGESSASSDSAESGGTTSKTTSVTAESTAEISGGAPTSTPEPAKPPRRARASGRPAADRSVSAAS